MKYKQQVIRNVTLFKEIGKICNLKQKQSKMKENKAKPSYTKKNI